MKILTYTTEYNDAPFFLKMLPIGFQLLEFLYTGPSFSPGTFIDQWRAFQNKGGYFNF